MVEELSTQTLWRIAIDNLDFKLKYAKNIGSSVLKKMLNLITGQVSTRTCSRDSIPGDQLKSLAKRALSSCTVVSEPLTSITDSHFLVNKDSECDYYFSIFSESVYASTIQRLPSPPVQATENLFCSLHKYMPHWTPGKADNIVFCTIEEAHASTIRDVKQYLTKLKSDLKIGQNGFPSKVLLCGDQHTYSIMKKLQSKYPTRFSWYHALPGDWHMLKLASEVLRDLLWDGGLHEFSYKCGHKGTLSQWQVIHLMLISTYELLLRKACIEFLGKRVIWGVLFVVDRSGTGLENCRLLQTKISVHGFGLKHSTS